MLTIILRSVKISRVKGAVMEIEEEIISDTDEHPESYGDVIVERLSARTSVTRLAKLTGLSQNIITYVFASAYFVVGVLCVTITEHITHYLPYIVGSIMVVFGVCQFVLALVRREYRQVKTNETASSPIIAALGVMIICEHANPQSNWPITFIAIVWGMLGLFEGAHAFNHALSRIANGGRSIFFIIRGVIECLVAFMLLYQPSNHDIHIFHIIVFGFNMIFDAVTMLPPVKAFLSK